MSASVRSTAVATVAHDRRPMSLAMSPEEIARALEAQGVPHEKARAQAGLSVPTADVHVITAAPPFPFPLRLTIPWSALCSDNARKRPTVTRGVNGEVHPRMALSARYKAAAERIRAIAREAMTVEGYHFEPFAQPLALVARVYRPSARRTDVPNFAKGVHDALSKIVYADDLWLCDARWLDAGTDVDRPRAEIEISPIPPEGKA